MAAPADLTFWSRRSAAEKWLLAGGLAVAAVIALAYATDTGTSPTAKRASTPVGCLTGAGLFQVGQQTRDVWEGFHRLPGFVVTITRLPTAADAEAAVRQADRVVAAQAGAYGVTGPSKGTVGADVVRQVAACLSG